MKLARQAERFLQKAANDERLLPSHISLFMAMFYYSPSEAGEAFQVCRRKLMKFSRIKSIATYHNCIKQLKEYGYIDYFPSYDPYRASSVILL